MRNNTRKHTFITLLAIVAVVFPLLSHALVMFVWTTPYWWVEWNNSSTFKAITPDGKYVVFTSHSNNLISGDTNWNMDLFVKDAFVWTTKLVNLWSDGQQWQWNEQYGATSITPDGRYIVFITNESLVEGDNWWADVYLRDMVAWITTKINIKVVTEISEVLEAQCDSCDTSFINTNYLKISNDGRYIFFQSLASNLVESDKNWVEDIFMRDTIAWTTIRINLPETYWWIREITESSILWSLITITPDGRYVLFSSPDENLILWDTNWVEDIFMRDTIAWTTTRINLWNEEEQSNDTTQLDKVYISSNWRYIFFASSANNLVFDDNNGVQDIFMRDIVAWTTIRVSIDDSGNQWTFESRFPIEWNAISSDGNYVIFTNSSLSSLDTNGWEQDVYLRDITNWTTTIISTNKNNTQAEQDIGLYGMSLDGKYILMGTPNDDFITNKNDINGIIDYFVKNTDLQSLDRITIGYNNSDFTIWFWSNKAYPRLSDNWEYVIYNSPVTNIVENDTNWVTDVFIRDVLAKWSFRASVGNFDWILSHDAHILTTTPDGNYVLFGSAEDNIVPNDTNWKYDIFWKNMVTGKMQWVNRWYQGNMLGWGEYFNKPTDLQITPDGRYVVFSNDAAYFENDTNWVVDVFVKDMVTWKLTRVNTNEIGEESNGNTNLTAVPSKSISDDGRYIAFISDASDLVDGDTNWLNDLFVKDIFSGSVLRVNTDESNTEITNGQIQTDNYTISSDGRYVFFVSSSDQLIPNDSNWIEDLFRKDLQSWDIVRVNTSTTNEEAISNFTIFSVTPDGRYVTFVSDASNLVEKDTNWSSDIFLKDLSTWILTVISVSYDGSNDNLGNGSVTSERTIWLTPDGRYVIFVSDASNLVEGDTNGSSDLFVRDNVLWLTTRVNISSGWIESSNPYFVSVTPDGRYIAFYDFIDGIVPQDNNWLVDLFVRDTIAWITYIASTTSFGEPVWIIPSNEKKDWPNDTIFLSTDGLTVLFNSRSALFSWGDLVKAIKNIYKNIVSPTPIISSPTEWVYSNSSTINIIWNGTKNSTIQVEFSGNYYTGFSDIEGSFALSIYDIPDWFHTLSIRQLSVWSNQLSSAVVVNVTIDTKTPTSPTILLPVQWSTLTNQSSLYIWWTWDVWLTVYAQVSGFIISTLVDGLWNWLAWPFVWLQNGWYSAIAKQTDLAGNNSIRSLWKSFALERQWNTITRVSIGTTWSQGNDSSQEPSIDAGGRYIVFSSLARNLVSWDTNYASDIFMRDTVAWTTIRISTSSTWVQWNGSSSNPKISQDGRYITFQSFANNLVPWDTNWLQDIFLKDNLLWLITRVNLSSTWVQWNSQSSNPIITPDGKYIIFSSYASNLVTWDTNNRQDLFWRDVSAWNTRIVTTTQQWTPGNNSFYNYKISSDGKYITFLSYASNFVTWDISDTADIFVKNMTTNELILVSTSITGGVGNSTSFWPDITPDGRYVLFSSYASNLVTWDTNWVYDIFVRDIVDWITTRVSTSSTWTQWNGYSYNGKISSNWRYVVFPSQASNLVSWDINGTKRDLFLKDMQLWTLSLLTPSTNMWQLNYYYSPNIYISTDNRFITFQSTVSDLVSWDTNNIGDTFVKDTLLNTLKRVSVSTRWEQQILNTDIMPIGDITSDGRYIVSSSYANNLVTWDTNGTYDIFLIDNFSSLVLPAPTIISPSNIVLNTWMVTITWTGNIMATVILTISWVIYTWQVDWLWNRSIGPVWPLSAWFYTIRATQKYFRWYESSAVNTWFTIFLGAWFSWWSSNRGGWGSPYFYSTWTALSWTKITVKKPIEWADIQILKLVDISKPEKPLVIITQTYSREWVITPFPTEIVIQPIEITTETRKVNKTQSVEIQVATVDVPLDRSIVGGWTSMKEVVIIIPLSSLLIHTNTLTQAAQVYGWVVQRWETVIIPIQENSLLQDKQDCYTPEKNVAVTLWLDTKNKDQLIYQSLLQAYWLTKFTDTDTFTPESGLKRYEAAKILVEYAKKVLCRGKVQEYKNEYKDIEKVDSTLSPYIIEAYEMWILKWSKWQFRPTEVISKQEFVAALVRMFSNKNMDVRWEGNNWDREYRKVFKEMWLDQWVGNTIERYDVAKIMYKLYYNEWYEYGEKGYYVPSENFSVK